MVNCTDSGGVGGGCEEQESRMHERRACIRKHRSIQGLSCPVAAWLSCPGSSQFRSLESGGEVIVHSLKTTKHCPQRGSRGKGLRRRPKCEQFIEVSKQCVSVSPGPVWPRNNNKFKTHGSQSIFCWFLRQFLYVTLVSLELAP